MAMMRHQRSQITIMINSCVLSPSHPVGFSLIYDAMVWGEVERDAFILMTDNYWTLLTFPMRSVLLLPLRCLLITFAWIIYWRSLILIEFAAKYLTYWKIYSSNAHKNAWSQFPELSHRFFFLFLVHLFSISLILYTQQSKLNVRDNALDILCWSFK